MNYWVDNWAVWVSAFCVLAIYSYLLKDNGVYRTMMQVFIGINVGYNVVVQWKDILYPRWWLPMLDGFDALFRGGPGSPYGALWALVGVLGLLWYFQLSRKYLWLSRIVIGITVGIGAGLTFKSQLGQNMPQVVDSFKPLAPAVVAPQPKREFRLPGAETVPALDDPVAYFVSGNELVCVETVHGVEVWRRPVRAVEPLRVVDGLAVVGEGEAAQAFERSGAQSEIPDVVVPKANEVVIPNGNSDSRVLRIEDLGGRLAARDLKTNEVVWTSTAPGRFAGVDEGAVFAADAGLTVIDAATGELVLANALDGAPSAAPRYARFVDPQFDRSILIVPLDNRVVGLAVRPLPAFHIEAGDVVWQSDFSEPVQSVVPLKGAVIVQGRQRSEMWQTPNPAPKLVGAEYFDNWVFVATMLSVMAYFFFSFRLESKAVQGVQRFGRWALMIGFGAFFGNTVMTRMSYLLDRLMFLIEDWLKPFIHHLFG